MNRRNVRQGTMNNIYNKYSRKTENKLTYIKLSIGFLLRVNNLISSRDTLKLMSRDKKLSCNYHHIPTRVIDDAGGAGDGLHDLTKEGAIRQRLDVVPSSIEKLGTFDNTVGLCTYTDHRCSCVASLISKCNSEQLHVDV